MTSVVEMPRYAICPRCGIQGSVSLLDVGGSLVISHGNNFKSHYISRARVPDLKIVSRPILARHCPACGSTDGSVEMEFRDHGSPLRVHHCNACGVYWVGRRTLGGTVYQEVPPDEVASLRFKRALRVEALMDRRPIMFGPVGTYTCAQSICRRVFRVGGKAEAEGRSVTDRDKFFSIRQHYRKTHPAQLPNGEGIR